ncbi:hypothetical protein GMMP1_570063 [Candidatus Magnetomoraceae bacterium gMMP-1]
MVLNQQAKSNTKLWWQGHTKRQNHIGVPELSYENGRSGLNFIHPFDDMDIITGQGTISLEIFKELKDIDIILVPIGGGRAYFRNCLCYKA